MVTDWEVVVQKHEQNDLRLLLSSPLPIWEEYNLWRPTCAYVFGVSHATNGNKAETCWTKCVLQVGAPVVVSSTLELMISRGVLIHPAKREHTSEPRGEL